jgi:hypothetical protein
MKHVKLYRSRREFSWFSNIGSTSPTCFVFAMLGALSILCLGNDFALSGVECFALA